MSHYYGWDGEPITMARWGELYQEERHVGKTQVGPYWISTVWLGIDHNWGLGPPLIFETMVFRTNYDDPESSLGDDLDMERYNTREQAMCGHARMVAKWRQHDDADE